MARVDSAPSQLKAKRVFFDLTTFTENGSVTFATLPLGAVVVGHTIDCTTALVAAAGTPNVTLKIGATDILGARAYNTAPYDGTVIRPTVAAFKVEDLSLDDASVTVSSSNMTAGTFNYFIEYYMSE